MYAIIFMTILLDTGTAGSLAERVAGCLSREKWNYFYLKVHIIIFIY